MTKCTPMRGDHLREVSVSGGSSVLNFFTILMKQQFHIKFCYSKSSDEIDFTLTFLQINTTNCKACKGYTLH